jgi:membrane peptidoglycan carboxypeptidase
VSSNDFDGPDRPAGGRGANDYSGGARGAAGSGAQGGSGAQRAGRHSAGRNGNGGGYPRGDGRGDGKGAEKYPEPEGWGEDGFWRDSGIDSDYETGLNRPIRTDSNGPRGGGGYSYWDGQGWQNSPGSGSVPTGKNSGSDIVSQRGAGADEGGPWGDRGAGPGAAGGFGAAGGYGPPGGGPGYQGGDPTAVYGNGPRVGGYGPGGPGRGGPGRGGRGRGPGGPGGPGRGRPGGRGKKGKIKGSWWRHWTWKKAIAALGSGAALFILLLVIAYYYEYNSTQIPTQELVADTYQNSTVYYSDGKTPIGTFAILDRQILTWNQIPSDVDNAVMAAEDRSFMTEGGVSPTGILRAAWDDLTSSGGNLAGGSTITQEFVRQYYQGIGTQQTLSRKIREAFVAMKISKEKSKQWILTNYLNTIYLGDNAYGVGAAAQTYFGVPASKLTVAQAAVIAAIIQQPTNFPQLQFRSELIGRWHYVLDGMVAMGKLTQAQANSEKFPKLLTDTETQQQGTASSSDPWAPYIMNVVANELEGVDHLTLNQLETGGYKIVTTISRPMEVKLYDAVNENVSLIHQEGFTLPSYAMIGAELQNPGNGAIVAMYPGRGQNMSQKECQVYDCDLNTAVYAREQVGSSFKPFVLSTAVSEGMNVKTSILNASPQLWVPPDSEPLTLSATSAAAAVPEAYPVHNDDYETIAGSGPGGATSVQNALAQSSNTAFTDLAHRAGTANIIQMAGNMGVNLDPYSAGGSGLPSYLHEVGMALGIAPMTVNEQDTMLATIDDNGTYHSAHIVGWYQAAGGPVQHGIVTTRVVLTPELDSQVQYAMEATTVDGTGTAAAMADGRPIIGKTGTTTNSKSAFFIGAVPQYALTVGIFTQSQNSNSPESLTALGGGGFGGTWPAAIWHTFAESAFAQLPIEQFQTPVFTGSKWVQVAQQPKKKPAKPKKQNKGGNGCTHFPAFNCPTQPPGHGHGGGGGGPTQTPTPTFTPPTSTPTTSTPTPTPTITTPTPTPTITTPTPGAAAAATTTVGDAQAGLALGGILTVLPGSLMWARVSRRRRRRRPGTTR